MTAGTVDQVELRAKLRAKLAAARVEAGRLNSLTEALDRARDQQRGVRAQLADSEAALADARRAAPQHLAYRYLNGDLAEADPVPATEAEVLRLQAELTKLEDIEAAIEAEIANVQAGLRDLHRNTRMAISDLIIASPEYQHLLEQHAAAFKRLRSIKVAMRLIGNALYGPPAKHLLETAEIWQPMEVRVGYPLDEELVEPWRSALEDLSTNADTLLPQADAAASPNGHLTRPAAPLRNGHPLK